MILGFHKRRALAILPNNGYFYHVTCLIKPLRLCRPVRVRKALITVEAVVMVSGNVVVTVGIAPDGPISRICKVVGVSLSLPDTKLSLDEQVTFVIDILGGIPHRLKLADDSLVGIPDKGFSYNSISPNKRTLSDVVQDVVFFQLTQNI